MDLSISIVSWNTCDLLDQCLRSVYETTQGIEFEVIVVDNASSDGSAQMAREKYPQVKLIENGENVGFAKANNQAYEVSRGRYFMLLNPDTVVLNNLAIIVRYMDSAEDVGVASCKCLNPDGSIQRNWNDYYPSLLWDMMPESLRYAATQRLYRRKADSAFDTKWVGGQCMTVRRKCIEQVGTMDPEYFMYTEETDWCYRIRQSGWSIRHFPGIVVTHFGGQSTKQDRSQMIVELYRSKTKFIRKNASAFHSTLFKVGLWVRTFLLLLLASIDRSTEDRRRRKSQIIHLLRAIPRF